MRWVITAVGTLFILLNLLHVTVGWVRLRRALAAEPTPARIADAVQVAWLGVGVCGACMGALLLALGPAAVLGDREARIGVEIVAVGLIVLGAAQFFATRKHSGLLAISVFGAAVIAALS